MTIPSTSLLHPQRSQENSNRLSRQIPIFLAVGISSVLVDYLGYLMLPELRTQVSIAKGLSYCMGMLVGFFGNRAFTFRARGSALNQAPLFVGLYFLTLIVNIGANSFMNYAFHSRMLAFLVATGITTIANFLGMKFFAFREPREKVEGHRVAR